MSEVEYNNLLYQISKRLDELEVGDQLLFLCRGKVTDHGEENIPTRSLIKELEDNGFLSSDRLVLLKRVLKVVEEWTLFQQVEKFEAKRKEYSRLLEKTVRVLDELNDLERLVSICRGKITVERQGNIHDVGSLFKELELNDWLGIDCLETLKEILAQTEKIDLLNEVEEFEQRLSRELKFERRKAQAGALLSSVGEKLIGVLNMKTLFKAVAGGFTIASSLELLIRDSTYGELITAVNTCVLPSGASLIQITEGCVCFKVQVQSRSALENLWSMYTDGTLKACLQTLLVTDEMREIAGGEKVEVIVTIDELEYEKARTELISEAQGPVVQREERQVENFTYINVQRYLEQNKLDIDSHSTTTETSDSGMSESHGAPTELGKGETNDSVSNLCLKDLSRTVIAELVCRLRADPTALQRFYQSFGLDREKESLYMLENIAELFPDTPVKLLKDVFHELQLYDLAEMLEKVKSRALRPSLPLKEMKKLLNASERPSKVYSKSEVLIIEYSDRNATEDAYPDVEKIGCFFQALNSQSQITKLTVKVAGQTENELMALRKSKETEDRLDSKAKAKEALLKERLGEPVPQSDYNVTMRTLSPLGYRFTKEERSVFKEGRLAVKKLLEKVIEEREQRKLELEKTVKKMQQKLEEMKRRHQGEEEKFQVAVSTVMDKWIRQAKDEDRESTLFVVLHLMNSTFYMHGHEVEEFVKTARGYVNEKLALIPTTKLVIEDQDLFEGGKISIPQETLAVLLLWKKDALAIIQELLNKRWMTLDLLSILKEAQRTLPIKLFSGEEFFDFQWYDFRRTFAIDENLSYIPRLHKDEQKPEPSDV